MTPKLHGKEKVIKSWAIITQMTFFKWNHNVVKYFLKLHSYSPFNFHDITYRKCLFRKNFLPFWKHPQLVLEKIKLEYHDQIKDIFFFVLSSNWWMFNFQNWVTDGTNFTKESFNLCLVMSFNNKKCKLKSFLTR